MGQEEKPQNRGGAASLATPPNTNESNQNEDCFVGSHDGYLVLADPVIHRRRIKLLKDEGIVVVEDILECDKDHDIEFNWHFADSCEMLIDGRKVLAGFANVRLEMTMLESNCKPELAFGKDEPPSGWISRRFDVKMPSPTVTWREKIIGLTRRLTFALIVNAKTHGVECGCKSMDFGDPVGTDTGGGDHQRWPLRGSE